MISAMLALPCLYVLLMPARAVAGWMQLLERHPSATTTATTTSSRPIVILFADDPLPESPEEVVVGWELLSALDIRRRSPEMVSCPTCGGKGVYAVNGKDETCSRCSGTGRCRLSVGGPN